MLLSLSVKTFRPELGNLGLSLARGSILNFVILRGYPLSSNFLRGYPLSLLFPVLTLFYPQSPHRYFLVDFRFRLIDFGF